MSKNFAMPCHTLEALASQIVSHTLRVWRLTISVSIGFNVVPQFLVVSILKSQSTNYGPESCLYQMQTFVSPYSRIEHLTTIVIFCVTWQMSIPIARRRWSMQAKESTQTLKPRVDFTRSPKQGYQWPHKKDWCPPNIVFKKIPLEFKKHSKKAHQNYGVYCN